MVAKHGGKMGGKLRVRTPAREHQKLCSFLAEGQAGQNLLAFEPFGLSGPRLDSGEQKPQQRRRHQ